MRIVIGKNKIIFYIIDYFYKKRVGRLALFIFGTLLNVEKNKNCIYYFTENVSLHRITKSIS